MATAACEDADNKQTREEFFAEQDAYIKKKFNFVQNMAHPCKFQFNFWRLTSSYHCLNTGTVPNKQCKKGNACLFIGFPADTCTYFIFGKCTQEKCRRTHYEEFQARYNNYKNEFIEIKKKETEEKKEKQKKDREIRRENERKQNEEKIAQDQEWLEKNTRICPVCIFPVEKLEGCDDMYCQKCKQRFDWEQMKAAPGGKNDYNIEQVKRNCSKWVPNDQPKDSLQLFVVLDSGKSSTYTVQVESKVEQLMQQIQDKTGILTDIQRLQYGGKQLNKDIKINEYGLHNNSNIFMVLRLPGGF